LQYAKAGLLRFDQLSDNFLAFRSDCFRGFSDIYSVRFVFAAAPLAQQLPDASLQHEEASPARPVNIDAVPLAQHGPASVSASADVKTDSPVIGQTRQLLPSVELYE
jgi:hypothetical protein